MKADEVLELLGGIGPFAVLGAGWIVNRRLQKANEAKTTAEAHLAEANAGKAGLDIQATMIANTKSLLAEARLVQAEKDAIKDEKISTLVSRVNRMENRFDRLRAALATHGVWDTTALIDLRERKPEYPDPPPFPPSHSMDDEE